jgi:selT/selW/selH-like putative selenoprotein
MASAIFDEFGQRFRVDLIPSKGGVFEVEVDGELIYSKKATDRHADYDNDVAPHIR